MKCPVYPAPMDLKLSDRDVVQPDILVVCDPKQIKKTHVEGPPFLLIEILSFSTLLHDRGRKLELYARSGVQRSGWSPHIPLRSKCFFSTGIPTG